MITIWEKPVLASVNDIVSQLRLEVRAEGNDLLKDMKHTNRNIMVTCPFHAGGNESKPSCGISTVDTKDGKRVYPAGTAHCFTCAFTGDLPEFVSGVLGRQDAGMTGYKWITTRFASVTVDQRKPLELNMSRQVVQKESTLYVSEEELASYRYQHDYMYHRKLNDKVIDYFDVGYDTKTDSLTFPVHDLNGRVLFVQRRSIGTKSFMNESVAEKGKVVYGLYHVYKNLSWIKEVYICESIIDALTCWVHRVPAVAILGALPTNFQLDLLAKTPIRKYVTALDNPLIDEAGKKGTTRIADHLSRNKLVNFLKFPEEVKDVNQMTEEQFNSREIVNNRYYDLK